MLPCGPGAPERIWEGEGAALGGSWAVAGLLGWAESGAEVRGERKGGFWAFGPERG